MVNTLTGVVKDICCWILLLLHNYCIKVGGDQIGRRRVEVSLGEGSGLGGGLEWW